MLHDTLAKQLGYVDITDALKQNLDLFNDEDKKVIQKLEKIEEELKDAR